MEEKKLYQVTSSPHIRSKDTTRGIMTDVVIALLPALAVAVYVFGLRAIVMTVVAAASCVFFEWLYRKLMKKSDSVADTSAVVTGVLLAYCMPVSAPYWMAVVGAFFAIVIVKQLYGGLGKNFMNPALAARAFLFSWPVIMTTWIAPAQYNAAGTLNNIFLADAETAATPLSYLHSGIIPTEQFTVLNLFVGTIGGSFGEVSALALLLGGVYLIYRKVISAHIPLSFIGVMVIVTFLFPRGGDRLMWMLYNVLSGGVMLGAIFMATDYVTSPMTKKGQVIFGAGCGLITLFIRYFGSYVEGVSYAILIMNNCTWLIDKATLPRRFGVSKEELAVAKAKAKEDKKKAKEGATA